MSKLLLVAGLAALGVASAADASCVPVHCTLSQWTETPCSRTCGVGTIFRSRMVLRPQNDCGVCADLTETESCSSACSLQYPQAAGGLFR